jgi:ribose transport system permease protein
MSKIPKSSVDTTGSAVETTGIRRRPLKTVLSPKNIGALYVWVLIIALFWIVSPSIFPTITTAKSILNEYSITGLMALSLLIPLATAQYDLSIGFTMSLSSVVAAYLLNATSWSPVLVGLVTIAMCVVVGAVNAFVVVGLGVNSFIGTLGTGAIISAITTGISNGEVITGRVGGSFSDLATVTVVGLQLPVIYMLVLMCVLGYVLERTRPGRFFQAIGFDRETARLTGIRVVRLESMAFLCSAVIAGFGGLVLAAAVSSADPGAGESYLIPAFSAAFLGATQFRSGRFNSWGIVVAVLMLGTGDVGLLIAGGPLWTPDLFTGVVLIIAVAFSGFGQSAIRSLIDVGRAQRVAARFSSASSSDGTEPSSRGDDA